MLIGLGTFRAGSLIPALCFLGFRLRITSGLRRHLLLLARLIPDAAAWSCFRLLLRLRVYLRLSPLVDRLFLEFGNGLLRILHQAVAWIALQKLFKRGSRLVGIVQIVFVDFTDGEQRVATIFAAGILLAQKLVLGNRGIQDLVIFETTAHLDQRFGHCNCAGIGLAGSRRAVVDAAIGVENALVVAPGTFGRGTAIQGFPHALGGSKVIPRPGFAVAWSGVRRYRGQSRDEQQHSPAEAT